MKIQTKFSKKTSAVIYVVFVVIAVGLFWAHDRATKLNAAVSDNTLGYAWSSNIGWISMNCTNTENDDGGACTNSQYGVDVNLSTGLVTGRAWANPRDDVGGIDNIGWLSFDSADLTGCPSGTCEARLSGGNFSGWARFLSNAGGWDGWLKLSGTAVDSSPYGVSLSGANLTGFAWGGDVVGWVRFDGVTITGGNFPTATLSASPNPVVIDSSTGLTWSSTNADTCTASMSSGVDASWVALNPGMGTSGSHTSDPRTVDTTYVITCTQTSSGATGQDSVTVTVTIPQCQDGIDNDGDTVYDYSSENPTNPDPGCTDKYDDDERNAILECSDGIDNDGDGYIDCGGVSGAPNAGPDRGCYPNGWDDSEGPCNPNDNDETDTPPQCQDGLDNDGDGFCDLSTSTCTDGSTPGDPGCIDADDDDERNVVFEEF